MLVYPLIAEVPQIKEVFEFLLSWIMENKEQEVEAPTPQERLFTTIQLLVNFKFT